MITTRCKERLTFSSRAPLVNLSARCPIWTLTSPPGYIGGSFLASLLDHSKLETFQITALLRNEEKARKLKSIGIKTVIGSNQDYDLLTTLSSEADIVFACVSYYLYISYGHVIETACLDWRWRFALYWSHLERPEEGPRQFGQGSLLNSYSESFCEPFVLDSDKIRFIPVRNRCIRSLVTSVARLPNCSKVCYAMMLRECTPTTPSTTTPTSSKSNR